MNNEKKHALQNHTVVVTGANGAIGRELCCRMSELGATVHGIARSQLDKLQQFLTSLGQDHRAWQGDVLNSAQINAIASEIGRCDILINTAGKSRIVAHQDLPGLSDQEFDAMLQINLRSVFSTTREFLPYLKRSDHALVINISSASALRTGGSNLAYAAAKAGVDSLTRNLAVALAPRVRVISLNPSAIDTGFVPLPPEKIQQIQRFTPLGRIATVRDVADAVEAYCTVLRYATGVSHVIDGGRTL